MRPGMQPCARLTTNGRTAVRTRRSEPAVVQAVNHRWCVAAGNCYRLRNAEWDAGRDGKDLEAIGDVYAARSTAILAEWEILTSD